MSVISNNQLAGAAGQGGSDAYEIKRSLRFNSGDSAYLNRTPSSAGNRKTWTWSGWLKRTDGGTSKRGLFGVNSTNAMIRFNNDDGGSNLRVLDNASGGYDVITKAKYRDPSAWYHFVVSVDTTQSTAADRVKIYVNGVQEDTFYSASYPTQNQDLTFNTAAQHNIGRTGSSNNEYLNAYLAEVHFIDGQALAPSNFGEYDDNNVWQPKQYSGSYGSNGFYLNFEDNSSASALGTDSSGNSNTWTVNNLSVTAGATNDSLLDTPTDYEASSGNPGGNYCTLNPLTATTNFTASDGNLKGSMSSGTGGCLGTMAFPKTGKWYFEVVFDSVPGYNHVGIATAKSNCIVSNANPGYDTTNEFTYWQNGSKTNNVAYGATFAANDVIGVAFDADAGSLVFYKNGTSQGVNATGLTDTYFPFIPGYSSYTSVSNFGQRPWAQTPPTGYKALCTFNFPDPSIADGSTVFDAKLYTGNGSTQAIAGIGFSPDLVWLKSRSQTNVSHQLYDVVRGASKMLQSDNTTVESTVSGVSSFDSNGFTLGSNTGGNNSGSTYVAWAWDAGSSTVTNNTDGSITPTGLRANPSAGFSVVTYNGTGSNATFGHGLNAAPELVIVKSRSDSQNWAVYSAYASGASTPSEEYAYLNTTNSWRSTGGGAFWNNTSPTSSVVHVGTDNDTNASGKTYVAYCFAPVAGYSAFGSYSGNGSEDGAFVYTGFRPAFILTKASSSNSNNNNNWNIIDTTRDPYNEASELLAPNSSGAVLDNAHTGIDILSNGFKLKGDSNGQSNYNGWDYIYAAFAEHPFKSARAR